MPSVRVSEFGVFVWVCDLAGCEHDAAAVRPDDRPLRREPRIAVALVLPALHVDVGPDAPEHGLRRRVRADRDPVHARQSGHVLRPQRLGNERPPGPLPHGGVGGDGDQQPAPQLPGLLKMPHVAGMDDVEAAVAQDHDLARGPGGTRSPAGFLDGHHDTGAIAHVVLIGKK